MLENFVPKAQNLLESIYTELEKIIQELADKIFFRFPDLKSIITDYAIRSLMDHRDNAEVLINQVLEAEISYIYTQEEEYLSIHGNLLPPKYKIKPETNPVKYMDMLDAFVIEIRERVVEYFMIVY